MIDKLMLLLGSQSLTGGCHSVGWRITSSVPCFVRRDEVTQLHCTVEGGKDCGTTTKVVRHTITQQSPVPILFSALRGDIVPAGAERELYVDL